MFNDSKSLGMVLHVCGHSSFKSDMYVFFDVFFELVLTFDQSLFMNYFG